MMQWYEYGGGNVIIVQTFTFILAALKGEQAIFCTYEDGRMSMFAALMLSVFYLHMMLRSFSRLAGVKYQ